MSALQGTRSWRITGPLLAVGEWLMILPAAVFVAVAALRQMQPAESEPAHASWIIFNWAAAHVTHFDAAVIFLVLPAAVVLAGLVALLWAFSENESLRRDLAEGFRILRANFAAWVVAAATLLGGLILAAVIVHLIVG